MVDVLHQNKLVDIFQLFVDGGEDKISLTGSEALDMSLTHTNAILSTYNIKANKEEQAQLFLCLAAVFALYSSSAIFGTENDSPTSVRNYALALLNKAVALVPSLINSNKVTDWKNRFWLYRSTFTRHDISVQSNST